MPSALRSYFAMERPVAGATGVMSELFLLSGVVFGTAGRWLVAVLEQGAVNWPGLIIGFIAAIIIFPGIYNNAGLKRSENTVVKWCLAFQNGYFWPVLLEQVGNAIK